MRIARKQSLLGDSRAARAVIAVAAAGVLALGLIANTFAATTVVTPSNPGNWVDRSSGGGVKFVADTDTAYGNGVLELGTTDASSSKANYALQSVNMPLGNVTGLTYDTKQVEATFDAGSATLQLSTCLYGITEAGCAPNPNGGLVNWTNLVYEPYVSEGNVAVVPGEWQTWNVSQGYLYSSGNRDIGDGEMRSGYEVYEFSTLKNLFPDAFVLEVAVNVGTYNPAYTIHVDGVTFSGTTYDFELDGADGTAPTAPVALGSSSPVVACGSSTASYSVVMDWTDATDNTGVVGYEYEVTTPLQTWLYPGTLTDSQYAGAFTDGEGAYTYRVRAVDAAGNYSEWSNLCTVTYQTEQEPEEPAVPTSKDDCKNGGWQSLVRADGSSFKNQGLCVSYVASSGNSKHHRA